MTGCTDFSISKPISCIKRGAAGPETDVPGADEYLAVAAEVDVPGGYSRAWAWRFVWVSAFLRSSFFAFLSVDGPDPHLTNKNARWIRWAAAFGQPPSSASSARACGSQSSNRAPPCSDRRARTLPPSAWISCRVTARPSPVFERTPWKRRPSSQTR